MRDVNVWLTKHKLILNEAKTMFMLIGTNQKLGRIDKTLNIHINNCIIKQVEHASLLGLEVDECLSWYLSIHKTRSKISKKIGMLQRVKKNVLSNAPF